MSNYFTANVAIIELKVTKFMAIFLYFYSQMSQAAHVKMEAHAGILQGVDGLTLLAYVHLDILAADVKLVSNNTYSS